MRLIDADALFINLDGMMDVSPTGYIHGDTVADMISDEPTVEAIHVDWLKEWAKKKDEFFEGELYAYLISAILLDWQMRKEE